MQFYRELAGAIHLSEQENADGSRLGQRQRKIIRFGLADSGADQPQHPLHSLFLELKAAGHPDSPWHGASTQQFIDYYRKNSPDRVGIRFMEMISNLDSILYRNGMPQSANETENISSHRQLYIATWVNQNYSKDGKCLEDNVKKPRSISSVGGLYISKGVMLRVFHFLHCRDLGCVARVSKTCYHVANKQHLWFSKCVELGIKFEECKPKPGVIYKDIYREETVLKRLTTNESSLFIKPAAVSINGDFSH